MLAVSYTQTSLDRVGSVGYYVAIIVYSYHKPGILDDFAKEGNKLQCVLVISL